MYPPYKFRLLEEKLEGDENNPSVLRSPKNPRLNRNPVHRLGHLDY